MQPFPCPMYQDIRVLRESRELTQAYAAMLCMCSLRAWIKWERGEHPMPAATWALFRLRTGAVTLDQLDQEQAEWMTAGEDS